MSTFINGIGTISAQAFNSRMNEWHFVEASGNRFTTREPDYKNLVPPMQLRRMSRVVKFGIAAAVQALQDAGIEKPDLITTGTAYGCLADTGSFLQKMISQQESLLTPTAFIQSTHNTVSGQIALLLGCHGHNFTYVQRGHSFESALQESILWLRERADLQILSGGIDEMTDDSFDIISRFGTYKSEHDHFDTPSEGCIAGEGANLFVFSGKKSNKSYAEIIDVQLCQSDDIASALHAFLKENQMQPESIDSFLPGFNGDIRYDEILSSQFETMAHARRIDFKKWCGEFPTSGAFALTLASNFLYQKTIPTALIANAVSNDNPPQNILIYNHYKNQYHSFILLRAV